MSSSGVPKTSTRISVEGNPEEGHEDDRRLGEPPPGRWVERAGAAQPGEQAALGRL